MAGVPWDYFVPYETSVHAALEKLRQKVFAAGEFSGSQLKPTSIDEALENGAEEGTSSILDMLAVGDAPDICTICPLSEKELERLLGTAQPTRQILARNMHELYENIDRGHGVYIVIYKDGKPAEYFFGGYSFD